MNLTAAWITAIGLAIEFFGFLVLANELWATNRRSIATLQRFARHKGNAARSIMGWQADSPTEVGGITIEGGVLEEFIKDVQPAMHAARDGRKKILAGISLSGIGAAVQIFAGFGQALHWLS